MVQIGVKKLSMNAKPLGQLVSVRWRIMNELFKNVLLLTIDKTPKCVFCTISEFGRRSGRNGDYNSKR